MNNTNLISTPNIEGNIGSCAVKNERVTDFTGFWKETGVNIATNSCTGEVVKTPFTSFAIGETILILAVVFFFGFAFGRISSY